MRTLAGLAAVGIIGVLTAGYLVAGIPSPKPQDWSYPLSSSTWSTAGYSEVRFGSYNDREESDFVEKRVLPAFADASGPPPASLGLFDAANSGHYQVFVRLAGEKFCAGGCRTLLYVWSRKRWRLQADAKTVSVLGKPGEYVLFSAAGPEKRLTWNAVDESFVEAPAR